MPADSIEDAALIAIEGSVAGQQEFISQQQETLRSYGQRLNQLEQQ